MSVHRPVRAAGPVRRLAASLAATAGLALASVAWSESAFWGRWRPEDSVQNYAIAVVAYGLVVQLCRLAAHHWRVAASGSFAWRRVFLIGALYGWLVEGVLVTTVVDSMPLTLSFTGLAWHALFTVLVGWWWIPRVLSGSVKSSILPLVALGAGVGTWAAFWRYEEGFAVPVVQYAIFVTAATVAYAVGLLAWWTFRGVGAPGIRGSVVAGLGLIAFVVVHGISSPITLVGPALVALAVFAIMRTARPAGPTDPGSITGADLTAQPTSPELLGSGGPAPVTALWRLVVVPVVAIAVFALFGASQSPIPTGWLFLVVTAPLGVVMFIAAWRRPTSGAWFARRRATGSS